MKTPNPSPKTHILWERKMSEQLKNVIISSFIHSAANVNVFNMLKFAGLKCAVTRHSWPVIHWR